MQLVGTGRVPAVIYGDKKEPTLISLDPKELDRLVHKKAFFATLLDVEIGGTKHRVLPRDVQFDPVFDKALHADFQRVNKDSKIHVNVPVVVKNEHASPGIKRGGVLNLVRHEIEFLCDPDNIPQQVVVDITGLDIGGSIHISTRRAAEGRDPDQPRGELHRRQHRRSVRPQGRTGSGGAGCGCCCGGSGCGRCSGCWCSGWCAGRCSGGGRCGSGRGRCCAGGGGKAPAAPAKGPAKK